MNVMVWFGLGWSLVFEVFMWLPQQWLFDTLKLEETLPFQALIRSKSQTQ